MLCLLRILQSTAVHSSLLLGKEWVMKRWSFFRNGSEQNDDVKMLAMDVIEFKNDTLLASYSSCQRATVLQCSFH